MTHPAPKTHHDFAMVSRQLSTATGSALKCQMLGPFFDTPLLPMSQEDLNLYPNDIPHLSELSTIVAHVFEFGLLNLMNTPEHCSAPFHSVSSKVAKSTKMAAAHIQTYVLHVTWSILYTYLITPPEPVRRHGESKCFELGEF